MKTNRIMSLALALAVSMVMFSCRSSEEVARIVPTAVSSVSRVVTMEDLNLNKDNCQIINTETAEAVVYYEEEDDNEYEIGEENGEFLLKFEKDGDNGWKIKYLGIVKYGVLSNNFIVDYDNAYSIARGLATYRLINAVQEQGADGVIEPIVTVKVGQEGKRVIYTASISAKLVKIKTK